MPINPYIITWILFALGFAVCLFLVAKARIDKNPVRLFSVESIGLLVCALVLYWLVAPGSESKARFGQLEFHSRTPSFLAQLLGQKDQTFEFINNDNRNYDQMILSASSEEIDPQVTILEGIAEEFGAADRENIVFYFAEIPPAGKVSGTSPPGVHLTPIPLGVLPKGAFPERAVPDKPDSPEN